MFPNNSHESGFAAGIFRRQQTLSGSQPLAPSLKGPLKWPLTLAFGSRVKRSDAASLAANKQSAINRSDSIAQ